MSDNIVNGPGSPKLPEAESFLPLKGFIQIDLQGVTRLIAVGNIAGISKYGDRCRISLVSAISDYGRQAQGIPTNAAAQTTNQFVTEEKMTFDTVKKLLAEAL